MTEQNTYAPEDIEKNKTMAGLSYLLFFLPRLSALLGAGVYSRFMVSNFKLFSANYTNFLVSENNLFAKICLICELSHIF